MGDSRISVSLWGIDCLTRTSSANGECFDTSMLNYAWFIFANLFHDKTEAPTLPTQAL